MVYPEMPRDTFWSYNRILHFIGKKSNIPPLGLITVAAMLPQDYNTRLIDMNIEQLKDEHILWADAIMTSTMMAQRESHEEVVKRANLFQVPLIAGGPYPTQYFDEIEGVDYFIIGEAESGILERFIADFENGTAKIAYVNFLKRKKPEKREMNQQTLDDLVSFFGKDMVLQIVNEGPAMDLSPNPRFDLLNINAYASMAIQTSRGCPYDCDFCSETTVYGQKPRLKIASQALSELKAIYNLGYRGALFIVDDDFVGNKRKIKPILHEIINFQKLRDYPFNLFTQADITLSLDNELMGLMRDAGFSELFVGLESPDKNVLRSINKQHNVKVNLLEAVRKTQSYGMEVSAGLIVGNDEDPPDIYDKIFDFCQEAGIPSAMVSLLMPLRGSMLYERLKKEDRLIGDASGNNTHDFTLGFVPKHAAEIIKRKGISKNSREFWTIVNEFSEKIIGDYKSLLGQLYDNSGDNSYERIKVLFDNLGPRPRPSRNVGLLEYKAFLKSLAIQGLLQPRNYFKHLSYVLINHPEKFPELITKIIKDHHYRTITQSALQKSRLEKFMNEFKLLREKVDKGLSVDFMALLQREMV